ncbi:MAG: hippurate hydrolase [Rhodobacteraceae bacterium HLUCCA08]|nr:MAG: hippurate hydrolase [Rhodobacteraceae bacterium HLUCCA08]
MPVLNRIAALSEDMATWRRHIHRHPETGIDCAGTAAYVAERLREIGVDQIHEGIGQTGVVAIIEGQGTGPTVGLRADMDALPIPEATGADWASERPGLMHACGHDGHTAMLLGAAAYLAETRNFPGRVALVFQPGEETGDGAARMIADGAISRFGIDQIYAIHSAPGTPVGGFYTTPGPIMAAVDEFRVEIRGKGGHGAYPHHCIDPIPAATAIAQAFQTIVSRNHDPLQDLVVSVTQIHAGTTHNVIPDSAWLGGTVRTFLPQVQDMVRTRMEALVAGHAAAYGVEAVLDYAIGEPPTVNDEASTALAVEVARDLAGPEAVSADTGREMGAEDFAYFLREVPGAFVFIGNGDTPGLHHPAYDFDDAAAPWGASFLARVAETALRRGAERA